MGICDSLASLPCVAALSLVVSAALCFQTWRAMRSAGVAGGRIIELEFAGNYAAFRRLLLPLDASHLDRLRIAHYWDSAFAVSYGVAIWSVLQVVAPYLPSGARGAVQAISWLGLVAGALDLLENACLLRRFATRARELRDGPIKPPPTDRVLRTAAVAAAVKFALIAFCVNALCWGFVQFVTNHFLGGFST